MHPLDLMVMGLYAILVSCNVTHGFIQTEPFSLPTADAIHQPLCLSVSDVKDTLRIPDRHIVVHDLQRTIGTALDRAFEASVPLVDEKDNCYLLRMVSVTASYRPEEHYIHKWKDGSSSNRRSFSLDLDYKALLYDKGRLIATFGSTVNHRNLTTERADLKKAFELMAEDLNAKVVSFLIELSDDRQ